MGRQRQFATFGCSRSAADLSRSSGGARERPLSRTPICLPASANVKFQGEPIARRENRRRLLWVREQTFLTFHARATGIFSQIVVYRGVRRSAFIDHAFAAGARLAVASCSVPFPYRSLTRSIADISFVRSRDGACSISTPSGKRSSSPWRTVSGCNSTSMTPDFA